MRLGWLVVAFAGLFAGIGLVATDPALAGARHKAKPRPVVNCQPQAVPFSWEHLLFAGPPQPNGCSPPVFEDGRFIGQDPDPNIRAQLRRDPNTGYTVYMH